MAEQYVNAFSKLAKDSNTVLLPSNPSDVTSMVAQVRALEDKRTITVSGLAKKEEFPLAPVDTCVRVLSHPGVMVCRILITECKA